MLKKWLVSALILCGSSCFGAESLAIGSVIGDGEYRIDNYSIKGSGTVFDGSMIETGPSAVASAVVRLEDGTEIRLYGGSRGVVHRDQFLLLRGKADLSASSSFQALVTGLTISTLEPQGRELIAIGPEGAVNVLARSGNLAVVADGGAVVAQVSPQRSLTFTRGTDARWQANGAKTGDFNSDPNGDDGDRDKDGDDHRHHHHHSK